ncbi:hypothetical protein CBF90_08455 [Microbacterium sp. AISO3]|uniref:hypothetical protein n=1 Tax=Microbacterium sp. AISO3 TaxID=2002831 RepID=UPI000B4D127C|nr:hypothetical protein [Microbacterium sp. AISO3]OWP22219.1 hypothetical protein CBF90_08455 [Microbacterium sp. AISO3]
MTTTTASPADSDAAAFAAAEETYRAYVEALNGRRSDPSASADPVLLLADEARQAAEETAAELQSAGVAVVGRTDVLWVQPVSFDGVSAVLATCVDSGDARVKDSQGNDVTPLDRPDRQKLSITVDVERALITNSVVEDLSC